MWPDLVVLSPSRIASLGVSCPCRGSYFLAVAATGTANNLNLSCYVLLGILCLLAAPRAFSADRMGWSRNSLSRHA
jgi:hypothetical protein